MWKHTIGIAAVVAALTAAAPAHGQGGDRGSGSVPMGSRGFEWQKDQELAKEAAAEFRAEIERLSDDEWREQALATLDFETGGAGLAFDNAYRVGGVTADRKAVTEPAEYFREDEPSWIVRFGKKPPRKVTLTLTDAESTEVECSIEELGERISGTLGVFLKDAHLLCFVR